MKLSTLEGISYTFILDATLFEILVSNNCFVWAAVKQSAAEAASIATGAANQASDVANAAANQAQDIANDAAKQATEHQQEAENQINESINKAEEHVEKAQEHVENAVDGVFDALGNALDSAAGKLTIFPHNIEKTSKRTCFDFWDNRQQAKRDGVSINCCGLVKIRSGSSSKQQQARKL